MIWPRESQGYELGDPVSLKIMTKRPKRPTDVVWALDFHSESGSPLSLAPSLNGQGFKEDEEANSVGKRA